MQGASQPKTGVLARADCVGAWSGCQENCAKEFEVTTARSGFGEACVDADGAVIPAGDKKQCSGGDCAGLLRTVAKASYSCSGGSDVLSLEISLSLSLSLFLFLSLSLLVSWCLCVVSAHM